MPSGLRGYNILLDGAKLNDAEIPEGTPFPLTGLPPATNYASRITIIAVDNAGNPTDPVSLADLEIAAATPVPTAADPLPDEICSAIDAIVASKLKPTTKVDGGLLHVKTPNGSYRQAYGGDRTANSPLTLDDKTRYGSISKMATNTLVLREIDRGHLDFADTVDMYIDGIPNGHKITIKNLLQMQSGLIDWVQQDPAVSQQYFLSPTAAFDAPAYIRKSTPLFEPGTQSSYSNANTVLMGMILEWCDVQFYGKSRTRRQIVLEEFCQPAGMESVEWPTTNYLLPPYARAWTANLALPQIQAMLGPFAFLAGFLGYPTSAELEWTAVNTGYSDSAGSLAGTIDDLVRYGEFLRDGELLSPEMRQVIDETFVTYLTYEPKKPWEGPGWMGFGLNMIEWGHWRGWVGGIAGYLSVLFWNTQDGSIIAASLNYFGAETVDLFYQIAYLLSPESTGLSDSVLRMTTAVPETDEIGGGMWLIDWATPGDSDGVTTLPHKVPFVL